MIRSEVEVSSVSCIDCHRAPSHGTVTLHAVGARGEYDVCLPCWMRWREHRREVEQEREARKAAVQ